MKICNKQITSIEEVMSDMTRLSTNHIVRFRPFFGVWFPLEFRRRVRIAGGKF